MLELAALEIALQKQPELLPLLLQIQQQSDELYSQKRWGDLAKWRNTLAELPDIEAVQCLLDADQVSLTSNHPDINKTQLYDTLQQLHPWRKGPFNFFDIEIDTEWRSDWKWQRALPHISPLHNRSILDVGCGNGYHCWRMRGAGAKLVLGIDPSMRFVMQYHALKKYLPQQPVFVLPYAMEQLPAKLNAFDTVFSMGVLYHRRSPFDHLQELFDCLRPGGELVLETLVLPTGHDSVLVPGQRYAQMRNVWFIPSADILPDWLARVGFKDANVVDVTTTSTDEQRSTQWMTFHSLSNFLDDQDPSKTVEGYPAPTRAIVVAQKPS